MHYDKHQCHMAASCTYHLPSPSCSTISVQKSLSHHKIILDHFHEKTQNNGLLDENMTRQKEQEDLAEKCQRTGKGNHMTAFLSGISTCEHG